MTDNDEIISNSEVGKKAVPSFKDTLKESLKTPESDKPNMPVKVKAETKKPAAKKRAPRKKAKPKVEEISASDLKTWIEGVESMQDDDWHPSPEQWQKIRDKIASLETTPSVVQQPVASKVQQTSTQQVIHEAPAQQAPAQSSLIIHEAPPTQAGPSVILPNENPLKPVNADGLVDVSPKVKPDGSYESSFGS